MSDTHSPQTLRPAEDPETPPEGLTWGIKRSFIRYISTLPDGGHAIGDGASLAHTSFFTFAPAPGSTFDPVTATGTLKFKGQVRLTGHHNMLFVMVADPWIELDHENAVLTVVDATAWPDRTRRIHLATLTPGAHQVLPGGSIVFPSVQARLAESGAATFGGNYPAGEEMDPLFVFHPPTVAARGESGL